MEKKINHLSSLSSEEIIKELDSTENSGFIEKLSGLKKISKDTNKQLIDIFQKLKLMNNEKANGILYDILSNQKISKMLKAFSSKELTDLLKFVKKYKKKTEKDEKNDKKEIKVKKEQKQQKEEKQEQKEKEVIKPSSNYKNIEISIENLLNNQMPFDIQEIENIPNDFEDINSFIDFYFKKEYYDNYKEIIDIYNIMNLNEENSSYTFYKNILITNLEVRCYGIFLTIEFEKIDHIMYKFEHGNLLIISSLDSSYIFITEIHLNPYGTNYMNELHYLTPPSKENNQKIKVKLLNVEVLKKLCLISNEVKFQMFEYENQLSLSKITLKALQELNIKKFSIPESFERIFSFAEEELELKDILKQVEDSYFNSRKIYNLTFRKNAFQNLKEKPDLTLFINKLIEIIDSPLLIVSRDNRSIDDILLKIFRNSKKLKIKKVLGHYNHNRKLNRDLFYNYHSLGFENKDLDKKIKYEWHNLKRSLSENRVNAKTIKYCQTYYNLIIDDFYEISGLKRIDQNNIKSQIVECFLNDKNLKGFIQSQIKGNPEEYLSKFSIFLNTIDKDFKINYLWERSDKESFIPTNQWKDNNYNYWINQNYDIFFRKEEEEEEEEGDDLFENDNLEKEEEKRNKIVESKKNKLDLLSIKNIKNKKFVRKNYWLLDETERREFLKQLQEQINDYDFNYHNNLVKCIELFDKQEIEYSYEFLKNQKILGMTIYNGIKLKEVIEKMKINTIIINNPNEVSRSSLISLFHPSIKNVFYLFSNF